MVSLSIITINYNNYEGLARTIASVKGQTFTDYEWLVIDGGSTDGSRDLIETNKEHFSYWCSEPDQGIYDAINKGIAHANGQYISCMNSGDTYFSDDTLSQVFARPLTADIVYGDWYKVYPDRKVLCRMPFPLDFSIFYYYNICHQAMFVCTSVLQEKGFDPSFGVCADYARWMEMLFAGASFLRVDAIVCCYDMSGASSHEKAGEDECRRIRREIIPEWLRSVMQRLNQYECTPDHIYLLYARKRGGLLLFLIHNLLKLMNHLYFHIDRKQVYLHRLPGQSPELS